MADPVVTIEDECDGKIQFRVQMGPGVHYFIWTCKPRVLMMDLRDGDISRVARSLSCRMGVHEPGSPVWISSAKDSGHELGISFTGFNAEITSAQWEKIRDGMLALLEAR